MTGSRTSKAASLSVNASLATVTCAIRVSSRCTRPWVPSLVTRVGCLLPVNPAKFGGHTRTPLKTVGLMSFAKFYGPSS